MKPITILLSAAIAIAFSGCALVESKERKRDRQDSPYPIDVLRKVF